MLLPELGTNGVRTEHPNHRISSQQSFDGRFGAGHDSDRFCKERVVCKSERRSTSSCEVQELLICPQVWPDTKHFPNFSGYVQELYLVLHGVLNSSCPHSMKIWTGH